MSTISNSAAGDSIFAPSTGSAITGQPNNKQSNFVGGTLDTSSATSTTAGNDPANDGTSVTRALATFVGSVDLPGDYSAVGASGSNTYLAWDTDVRSVLSVGDFVVTNKGWVFPVLDITNAGTRIVLEFAFADTATYVALGSADQLRQLPSNIFKQIRQGDFPGVGFNKIAGSTSYVLTGGSSADNEGTHVRETIRTTRTSSAIRAGYWDEYNANFTTAPTTADDTSSLGTDVSVKKKRTTFTMGGTPTNKVV